jgi:hypothetical protein
MYAFAARVVARTGTRRELVARQYKNKSTYSQYFIFASERDMYNVPHSGETLSLGLSKTHHRRHQILIG